MFKNEIEIDDKVYGLNYSVTESESGYFTLSVSKDYDNNILDKSTLKLAPITFDTIVEIIEVMCRNTVTPTYFREIAEELILNKLIVE